MNGFYQYDPPRIQIFRSPSPAISPPDPCVDPFSSPFPNALRVPKWVFPNIEIPQNGWFIMENLFFNRMIRGYHYFRKHPECRYPIAFLNFSTHNLRSLLPSYSILDCMPSAFFSFLCSSPFFRDNFLTSYYPPIFSTSKASIRSNTISPKHFQYK